MLPYYAKFTVPFYCAESSCISMSRRQICNPVFGADSAAKFSYCIISPPPFPPFYKVYYEVSNFNMHSTVQDCSRRHLRFHYVNLCCLFFSLMTVFLYEEQLVPPFYHIVRGGESDHSGFYRYILPKVLNDQRFVSYTKTTQ
jgi:hypothetical protein